MKALLTAAVILVGVAVAGWKYWDYVVNPWTRNCQVMAQVIQITPRVTPLTSLAAQRPFRRKIGQQPEGIAMQCANQDLNRLRQPNLLPFSASWRCYLGNLGLMGPGQLTYSSATLVEIDVR